MLNSINLQGRLTADPEIHETKNGKTYATATLAVKRSFGDGTDFFSLKVWNNAEIFKTALHKGSMVIVSGQMESWKKETDDGKKITYWEVRVFNFHFTEPKKSAQIDANYGLEQELTEINDDDGALPF